MSLSDLKNFLLQFGFEPRKLFISLREFPQFIRDYRKYTELLAVDKNSVGIPITNIYPILHEKKSAAGEGSGHYFHQDIWAARKIYERNPAKHIDVGSSVNGFLAHLLVFREVEAVDIRPLVSNIRGLKFIQGDATKLDIFRNEQLESISTLHAVEHFGLGRYGDPVDPAAYYYFLENLKRVLKPGGHLYLSAPCGVERLYFNAHRVFNAHRLIEILCPLELRSFSCVKDDGAFYENCFPDEVAKEEFGLGLFEFRKN